jgi:hypothetical protein
MIVNTMQSGHMTDSKAQDGLGQQVPEVDTEIRNEPASGFNGWVLTSGQGGEADAPQTAEEARSLITARRFSFTKHGGVDESPIRDLLAHITDEELAGFRFACAEAARAELELSNPLAGLNHYRAALHSFPFLPGLDGLRDKLIASARYTVDASLRAADESLKHRRTWKAAQRALDHASALMQAEPALHIEFAARHALLESVASRATQLSHAGQGQLDLAEEHALLRDLHDALADDPDSYWYLPGWRSVRERLNRLDQAAQDKALRERLAAQRQWLADAHTAYNDASAGAFIERYMQAGNPPPRDEDVAQLQLTEAEALIVRANELVQAYGADAPALLHNELDRLEGWQRDLRALLAGLNLARHRAELGLREPEQLDVARYVLGIGVGGRKPATALHQAPHMFVGHPSLLRCKSFVEACAARRRSQERLFDETALCLRFDTATTPEEITPPGAEDILHSLRSHLQACTAYPIEIAWDKVREMARAEPDDACDLQQKLVYRDTDDHGREVVTLPATAAVLERKVRQIHILRDWLLNFTPDTKRAHLDFPGAINWEQERKDIEGLRDSGPAGLTEAQARCRSARSGDGDGATQGLWSLERLSRALSQHSMMTHLRRRLAESPTAPDATEMPLCAAARDINHKRHDLWLSCERQLHACDQLAKDIASRIEHFALAWDEFESCYRALMRTSSLRRNRAAESAEWQGFQRAAERFCSICPNYGVFQSKLQDVQARFKLQPACLDGGQV